MHNRFLILANLAFGCVALLAMAAQAKGPDDADKTAALDEEMLRKEGLSTETKDLVAWLKERSENDEDLGRIDKLIEQLGYTDRKERETAQHKLAMLGLNGWTQIIKAAKRTDNPIAGAAKACMEEIEKEHHAFLNLATVRLLVYRKAPDAVEALLRYLPFTVDENVEEEIYYGLDALALTEKKLHPALLAALKDGMGTRRAVAACIIGRVGDEEQKAAVRKLLDDKDAHVRLRAAQGLLAGKDKAAVPTLIKLLTNPSPSIAWQADELLQCVAGELAPRVSLGKDIGEKAVDCRAAWASWWVEHEAKCDLDDARRSGRRPGLLLFSTGGSSVRVNNGSIWLCGCNSIPELLSGGWSLRYPWHVEWLRGERLLLADWETISVKSLDGHTDWKADTVKMASLETGPICEHRFPACIYFRQNVEEQSFDRKGKIEVSDVWALGFDGSRKPLSWEKRGQTAGRNTVAKRLENGDWLSLAPSKQEFLKIDGRLGKPSTSTKCEGSQWSNRQLTFCPLSSGDVLVVGGRGQPVEQFTGAGERVFSYGQGKTRGSSECKILARLRTGSILLQSGYFRLVEVSRDGHEQWDVFSEREDIKFATRCLPLVGFGFPSRPADLDIEAVKTQGHRLKSQSIARRRHALALLQELGADGLAALPEAMDCLLVKEVNPAAQDYLATHLTMSAPLVLKWMDSAEATKRAAAVGMASRFPEMEDEFLRRALELLKDPDKAVRLSAIGQVGYFDSHAAVVGPALVAIAGDGKNGTEIRTAALKSLSELGPLANAAVPAVLELMRDKDGEVRCAAIRVLPGTKVADPKVDRALIDAIGDQDANVQAAAAGAIQGLGLKDEAAIPRLIKALATADNREVDESQRNCIAYNVSLILATAREASKAAVPALIKVARNRLLDNSTRRAAIDAIAAIGRAAGPYLDDLRELLSQTDDDDLLRKRLEGIVDRLR